MQNKDKLLQAVYMSNREYQENFIKRWRKGIMQ